MGYGGDAGMPQRRDRCRSRSEGVPIADTVVITVTVVEVVSANDCLVITAPNGSCDHRVYAQSIDGQQSGGFYSSLATGRGASPGSVQMSKPGSIPVSAEGQWWPCFCHRAPGHTSRRRSTSIGFQTKLMDGTPLHPPVVDQESYGLNESRRNTIEWIVAGTVC
jgi:hypothetical protein